MATREPNDLKELRVLIKHIKWSILEEDCDNSRADPEIKTIFTPSNLRGFKKTLDVAHEYGHAVLIERGRPVTTQILSNSDRFELLATEILAWEEAWIALQMIDSKISRKRFLTEASKYIMPYVRWAASRSRALPWA